MSDIFLCYSRADSAIAQKVASRLQAEKWSVFMDVQTQVGARWQKVIQRELDEARAVVVLWTAASCASDFVFEEAEHGRRRNVLFPVLLERVQIPYGFLPIQTAGMIGWQGAEDHVGLHQLLKPLRLHLLHTQPSPGDAPSALVPPLTPTAPGERFRDRLRDGGEGPLLAVLPAGRFLMGSPIDEPGGCDDEGPAHEVEISYQYAMGVHAVTFEEFDLFCAATNRQLADDQGWGRARRPAINVSWDDAWAYCTWLRAQTGERYGLPSESQWEYACRAGTSTPFCFGRTITTDRANFNGVIAEIGSPDGWFLRHTTRVGAYEPNAFGLHDMHGNVWEWCQDRWHETYDGAPSDGSAWEARTATPRVVRGGSWSDYARKLRSAKRDRYRADNRSCDIGFRVCRMPLFLEPGGVTHAGTSLGGAA